MKKTHIIALVFIAVLVGVLISMLGDFSRYETFDSSYAQKGKEMMINAERCKLKGYTFTGFYWGFGDGKYNIGNNTKHVYTKSGIYTIELGVTARNEATYKIEKFKVEKKIIVTEIL